MSRNASPTALSRRAMLRGLGATAALLPLSRILGCSPGMGTADAGADVLTDTDAMLGTDAALAADAAAADAVAAGSWATGGTAAMTALSSYPDPFAGSNPTSCSLICQTTIGPCHTTSPEREDVSEGLDGIPVRLAFRVLNESCEPIPNAIVEIWQTNNAGVYSGNINTICNSAAEDRAASYFRGYQRADASGRVNLNTVFPGWYRGRAVHIHVRVMTGDYNAADNATASVITQMLFTDELVRQVFTDVPLYASHGLPDTYLTNDNVVSGASDRTPFVLEVARMSDGAMLASKTLIVRASTATSVCSVGMGGGPMM